MSHPGGSAFTSGDDFIAARVSIDVPTEGIQSLREMSTGINNFRASVEAAAKSTTTFVGYVQQLQQAGNMATEAYRNLAMQMERNADAQQRAAGGGVSGASALPLSRAAPQGYVDPWAGMGSGVGGQRMALNSADQIQQQAINPARQLDPYKYVNAQAGRYRVMAGDIATGPNGAPDIRATADRVEARDKQQREQVANVGATGGAGFEPSPQSGGLARNLMNEMAPGGGSHMGMLGVAQRAMGRLGSRAPAAAGPGAAGTATAQAAMQGGAANAEDAASKGLLGSFGDMVGGLGGGLGAAFGAMGRAAGPVGIGLAGLGALEKGGAMYQGYKNMGLIRGGGAAEGMQDELAIRSMAMNPFLSTEQSRQIVMAGLTEGYSGKQFDTVTQFMASNLKDMNLQVSDSVQMLRKNVAEGGQSITGLTTSLAVLKEMSKSGYMSLPDMQQMFKQGTGQLISSGVNGGAASQAMIQSMGWFADNKALAQFGPEMVGNAGNTAAGGAMLEAFSGIHAPGLDPSMFGAYATANGMDISQISGKALTQLAQSVFRGITPDPKNPAFLNRVRLFKNLVKRAFNVDRDNTQAMQMAQEVLSGGNPATRGAQQQQETTSKVTGGESFMSDLGQTFGSLGHIGWDLGKAAVDAIHGDFGGADRVGADISKVWSQANYRIGADAQNPVLNSIVDQYGANGVEAVDSSGNGTPLTGSRAQVEAFAKGDLRWRRKGEKSNGITLAQTPPELDQDFRTGGTAGHTSQTNVNFSPASVKINFDNGGMTATPNPVQLTPNQQAVNSGVGDATMNNPPPGDGYGYWPGRSPGLR